MIIRTTLYLLVLASFISSISEAVSQTLSNPGKSAQADAPRISLIESEIKTGVGVLPAQRGALRAPYFHAKPDLGMIEVPFIRFVSKAKGSPIFLLAGGPGNTYTDDLVKTGFSTWLEQLLLLGDVIILEHRGSSTTTQNLDCYLKSELEPTHTLSSQDYQTLMVTTFSNCATRYQQQGIPLDAFNIIEMAQDYLLLSSLLGYDKINLIGGSFGSQLGLTIINLNDTQVDRAIFYGVEGPGDTLDQPENAEGHITRLTDALKQDWQFNLLVGDLKQHLSELFSTLKTSPLTGSADRDSESIDVTVGEFDLKLMLWSQAGLKGYRRNIARIGQLLAVTNLGFNEFMFDAKLQLIDSLAGDGLKLNLMTFLVDCASLSPEHKVFPPVSSALFGAEIVDSELRAVCSALDVPIIESNYREGVVTSDIPALFVSGGLDGFTPPEYAKRVVTGFKHGHLLYAPYGDHNGWAILDSSSALMQSSLAFLSGRIPAAELPALVDMRIVSIELLPTNALVFGFIALLLIIVIVRLLLLRKRKAGKSLQLGQQPP